MSSPARLDRAGQNLSECSTLIEHLLKLSSWEKTIQVSDERSQGERRVPIQSRSRERRERIIDATADLLAAEGLEAVTTNAIAARAQTSIGSVYEFFPNRAAVLAALTERYLLRLRALADDVIAKGGGSWEALAEGWVAALAEFYRTEPGYRQMWLGAQLSPELQSIASTWMEEFTARIAALTELRAPQLPLARRTVIARTVVHLVSSLLAVAVTQKPRARNLHVREAQRAVVRYLRPYLRATRK